MDWTNDMVLNFLKAFKAESIIWDPKHHGHKKKHLLSEAWIRLHNTLNWECNIEDLKKKRDSLMAYYRIHLNKIRKSKTAGKGAEEDYKTSWFAFDTMNRFLGNIYDIAYITEGVVTEKKIPMAESTDSAHGFEYLSDSDYQPKRKRQEAQHTFVEQDNSRPDKDMNECEMYSQLLAHRLNKLDEIDRLILMNKIDNLVFETIVASKAKKRRIASIINISSVNQDSNTHDADPIQCNSPHYYDNRDLPSPTYEATEPIREPRADDYTAADSSHSFIITSNSQPYSPNQSPTIKEEY